MDPLTATIGARALEIGVRTSTTMMTGAIRAIYNVADSLDDWLDAHIGQMKESENTTIARTGRVLEATKFGFGLGYIAPTVAIAAGQLLLGNQLSAAMTLVTSATLTNPIAMTCAAIGAIYYGWSALSDQERDEIIEKLSAGFAVGIELIRSVVNFVIGKTKELLSSKQLSELKDLIRSAASTFGRKLGDITQSVADKVADAALAAKDAASTLARNASSGVAYSTTVAAETAAAAAATTARGAKLASSAVAGAVGRAKEGTARTLDVNGDGSLDWNDVAATGKKLAGKFSKRRPRSINGEPPDQK
ncbi:hypothetical protein [Niveibacterium sp. COAC-50]|uniref:hypothetical protein n=1 Tax=Niveibacterium sp. COAC-50 TaxID=2729384 RepID=UPI001555B928|nr:hypothetical protein [Niveibacterium sp. COAC-50]